MNITQFKIQNKITLWDSDTKTLHETMDKVKEICDVDLAVVVGGRKDRQIDIEFDSRSEMEEGVRVTSMMGGEVTTESPPPTGRYA